MLHKGIFHFHLMCACFQSPPDGNFTVGQEYTFEETIDTVKVPDDLGQIIVFPKEIFKSYFYDSSDPVTSFDPMPHDKTIYRFYFVLEQGRCDLEAIKAYSKLMNVNYIQAKRRLNKKRVFIATGNAYDIRELLSKIANLHINYEITPPYPYQF